MNKIKISKISPEVFKIRGFEESLSKKGCFSYPCGKDKKGDACCGMTVLVDKMTYSLILKNRKKIERKIKTRIEDFVDRWSKNPEFLGGASIETRIRKENRKCMFHLIKGRGCELVKLVLNYNLPRRMIPSCCRVYPLDWNRGKLFVHKIIPKNCYFLKMKRNGQKSLFETMKKEIRDIFEIKI